MTNIKISDNRIICDGHSDIRQECEVITLMCDNLAKSKDFKTIKYESGYAEFEKVGKAEELKFPPVINNVTMVWDEGIEKIEPFTSSGETKSFEYLSDPNNFVICTIIFKSGYSFNTVTVSGNRFLNTPTVSGNTFELTSEAGGGDNTVTITSKKASTKQTIDVSTLSGWAALASGQHSITIKTKTNGYADSESSNAVSVSKVGV